MKWLRKVIKSIVKKDLLYKIDYIRNNKQLITLDILYGIKTNILVDNTNKPINLYSTTDKLSKTLKIIDETIGYIPLEYSICGVVSDRYTMLDFVTMQKGVIPSDYIDTIITMLDKYLTLLNVYNNMGGDTDDLDYQHNSSIISLYITNMDIIIQKLFDAISE